MPEPSLPVKLLQKIKNIRFRIHPRVPFTITIVILLYLSLNAWIYFYGTKLFNFNPGLKNAATSISVIKEQGFGNIANLKSIPAPLPRPIAPLPSGKQSWKMTHGPGVIGPKIDTATVDPLTPDRDTMQTVTITAKHNAAITHVTAILVTDHTQKSVTMARTNGSDTDGAWSASWQIGDTYDHTYQINFILQSATGDWSGGLTFRQ